MFQVNNKDTKLVFVLVSLLLTYFIPCYSVSIVNFDLVNTGWDVIFLFTSKLVTPVSVRVGTVTQSIWFSSFSPHASKSTSECIFVSINIENWENVKVVFF